MAPAYPTAPRGSAETRLPGAQRFLQTSAAYLGVSTYKTGGDVLNPVIDRALGGLPNTRAVVAECHS